MSKLAKQTRPRSICWSREKISRLIQLYREHECLWNHYSTHYKDKDKRQKAINDICQKLEISKFEFGKKIHNLRNQFNSELKKLERRIEAGGGNPMESDLCGGEHKCRWEYFQALMFLRNIIEPRPGSNVTPRRESYTYQTVHSATGIQKKFKYNYGSEDDEGRGVDEVTDVGVGEVEGNSSIEHETEYQLVTTQEEIEAIHTAAVESNEEDYGELPNPVKSTTKVSIVPVHSTNASSRQSISIKQDTLAPEDESPLRRQTPNTMSGKRDQWDSFGDLIASEIRCLRSDSLRRKLKRKIMQALLEVDEEDEERNGGRA